MTPTADGIVAEFEAEATVADDCHQCRHGDPRSILALIVAYMARAEERARLRALARPALEHTEVATMTRSEDRT